MDFLLCSKCFKDQGLKLDSEKFGFENTDKCPNCKSREGKKLNKNAIEELANSFFVQGTLIKLMYGGTPLVNYNEFQKTEVNFSSWLFDDVKLFEKILNIGFFHYGPNLWMVGDVEPLLSLIEKKDRNSIITRILNEYPTKFLTTNDLFYRIRLNPENPSDPKEYDSPPVSRNGRLDSESLSILYGSQDIDVCIHECRSTIEDDLYIASLVPKRDLKMIDFSHRLNEDVTEFESLDIAMHMLFSASSHSYEICRDIAGKVKEAGYDGIIYTSYFRQIRTGLKPYDTVYGISSNRIPSSLELNEPTIIQNIAIFGKPLEENIISIKCINRLILRKIDYIYNFGPVEIK
jgi:hypothetical protein